MASSPLKSEDLNRLSTFRSLGFIGPMYYFAFPGEKAVHKNSLKVESTTIQAGYNTLKVLSSMQNLSKTLNTRRLLK